MGCGKSTVGHMVARDLKFSFVDTDSLVEERAGISVAEIFRSEGESVFRNLEKEVISDLAGKHNVQASRIAHGVPLGGELEYVDGGTLSHAFFGRRAVD